MTATGYTSGDPRKVNVAGDTMTGALTVDANLSVVGGVQTITAASSSTTALQFQATGDTVPRLKVAANGLHSFGDGTDPTDTTLYRSAAGLLQTDGDLNTVGRLSAAGWQLPMVAPTGRRPAWRPASTSQQFQSGHGWTVGGGGTASSNVNDTTTFVRGTQSVRITTAANGVQSQIRKLAQPSFDLTGKLIRIILKVDDVTHLNKIEFLVGTSSFTNFFRWEVHTHSATNPNYVNSGEWVTINLNWADVAASGGSFSINSNGTPSVKSGFTDMQVNCYDDAVGAVTYHLQAIEFVPDSTTTFPNGVVSITFDDSYQNIFDLARPVMDNLGYRGTMYNIAQAIGTANYLTVSELRSLQDFCGWEMGGHAYSTSAHTAGYNALTAQQVSDDFRNLRAWMVNNGLTSEHFAYPHGQFNLTTDNVSIESLARNYFTTARSIISENVESFGPAMPYRLKSITGINDGTGLGGYTVSALTAAGGPLDRCQLSGDWLILCFHQVTSGAPTDSTMCSQAGFTTVMNAINSRGIPVVPVSDVMRYYS